MFSWLDEIYKLPLSKVGWMMAGAVLLWAGLMSLLQLLLVKAGQPKKKKGAPVLQFKTVQILNLLLALYALAGIFYFTLNRSGSANTALVLRPFQFLKDAKMQPEVYRSVLMNVFLFLPLGLFLPFVLPEKWKKPVLWTILFAFTVSALIECAQLIFGLGKAETDDMLANTVGAALGCLAYVLSYHPKKHYQD